MSQLIPTGYIQGTYKILDSGISFRVFWKVLCRNEILVFLGSAQLPYRVKMRSFQKVFSKISIFQDIAPAIWVFLGL